MKLKPMLTTATVAELLGGDTTDAWVRERCADGTIPAHKIGRSWRIDVDEFAAWREGQRFVPDQVDTFEPARSTAPVRSGGLLLELVRMEDAA